MEGDEEENSLVVSNGFGQPKIVVTDVVCLGSLIATLAKPFGERWASRRGGWVAVASSLGVMVRTRPQF